MKLSSEPKSEPFMTHAPSPFSHFPLIFSALSVAAVIGAGCPGDVDDPDGGTATSTMDSTVDVDENGRPPALVCPGANGCASAEGAFQAGAATRVITPVVEPWTDTNGNGVHDLGEPFEDLDGDETFDALWMAGFDIGRLATGVHDDMWTRVLVVERGDVRLAFVALDLIGYFADDGIAIRVAARARGLDLDHVVVASTHQHEGPDTMGMWGKDASQTGYDPTYIAFIVEQTVDALADAVNALTPSRLTVGRAFAPSLVADSREPQVIDASVTTLAFDDVTGGDRTATLVVFGNHPEALSGDNTLLTSDYPHYLREALETERPGSVGIFMAGTLGGLMNPLHIIGCPDVGGNETCGNGSFEKAQYIGDNVAALALTSLVEDEAVVVDEPELSFRRLPVLVPGTNEVFLFAFKLGLLTRDIFTPEGERIAAAKARELDISEIIELGMHVGSEINSVTIGPVAFAAVPGEIYPELWLVGENGEVYVESPEGADFPDAKKEVPIMAVMPDAPFKVCLNNANDALGYIIPKPQFDFTAPYAYKPDGQYGEQNSLGEESAPTITEAFKLLYELTP